MTNVRLEQLREAARIRSDGGFAVDLDFSKPQWCLTDRLSFGSTPGNLQPPHLGDGLVVGGEVLLLAHAALSASVESWSLSKNVASAKMSSSSLKPDSRVRMHSLQAHHH